MLIEIVNADFLLGMIKNGCGQSGHGILKLNVSEE